MQDGAERVFRGEPKEADLIFNVPPGTTKSTLLSVLFPSWALAKRPDMHIICGSHTQELVLDLSTKCRDVLRSEQYINCFPNVQLREDQDTKGYWATTKGGWRLSVTVGGKSPTGFHGHFLIVDDPIDPEKARSEAEIKAANNWMTTTLPSRKIDHRVTLTALVMQRLHQNDPTGHRLKLLGAGPVKHFCLPASDEYPILPERYKEKYVDGLLDPVRLPRSVLNEKRVMLGSFGYAGQFGQSPIPLGGNWFIVAMLKHATPSHLCRWKRLMRYWDKAATDDGGAWTAGVKLGEDTTGRLWLLDVVRGQWGPGTRERIILNTAINDGRVCQIGLEQEPGSGGKESAQSTVRMLRGFAVIVDKPTGEKTLRAQPLASQVNDGQLYVLENAPWLPAFVDEMLHFPESTYKDQIDAASGAFNLMFGRVQRIGALPRHSSERTR